MLCSPLSVNRRFGGTYHIHLASCLLAGFLLNLFLRPWGWRRYVPPKRQLTLNRLHSVISQNLILFITTAVRTSNPTFPSWFSKIFSCFHLDLIFDWKSNLAHACAKQTAVSMKYFLNVAQKPFTAITDHLIEVYSILNDVCLTIYT
jgi:hypothetical protein